MGQTRKRGSKINIDRFPLDNNNKKWSKSKTYKNWVGDLKETRQTRRSPKKDLCSGKNSICTGNLGIPRKHMPQFTLRRAPFSQNPLKKFRKFIKTKYGIKSKETTRMAIDLKPSQSEISKVRVEGLIEDNLVDSMEVPIVVSNNDYVIDGHHRWAVFRLKAPKKPIKAVVIDAPVRDVLGMAVDWGASTQSF